MTLPLWTERLLLRTFAEDDLEAVHRIWSDPENMYWIPSGPSRDLDHSRQRLATYIEHQQTHGFSMWALCRADTEWLLGDCGLFLVEGKGPQVELAYLLDRAAWDFGYATEAARATVEYGLYELNLPRLVGMTDPQHSRSQRVLRKCGLREIPPETHYGQVMAMFEIRRSPLGEAEA